jgi:hypothetical protein
MSTLSITANRFIASSGKLDSNRRYVFQVASGEQFLFPTGRTIDLPTRGLVYNMAGVQRITGTSSSFAAETIRMRS